ncbi:hypothetical protein T06_3422 [Trichinella sp. T6]|nr:hypothetical protein T06_3422 [Trichinella sp. T6]
MTVALFHRQDRQNGEAEPPGRKCKPNQRPTGAELLKPAQHNRHVITQ